MATMIGAYMTVPLVLLSGLFLLQILRSQQKSYARLSFKAFDVRVSFQMMMLGFVVLAFSRVPDFLGLASLNLTVSLIAGSTSTVLMTAAFVILNSVVYGPDNFLYYHLPSNYLGSEDRYAHPD
jgi:hypothetical protein